MGTEARQEGALHEGALADLSILAVGIPSSGKIGGTVQFVPGRRSASGNRRPQVGQPFPGVARPRHGDAQGNRERVATAYPLRTRLKPQISSSDWKLLVLPLERFCLDRASASGESRFDFAKSTDDVWSMIYPADLRRSHVEILPWCLLGA